MMGLKHSNAPQASTLGYMYTLVFPVEWLQRQLPANPFVSKPPGSYNFRRQRKDTTKEGTNPFSEAPNPLPVPSSGSSSKKKKMCHEEDVSCVDCRSAITTVTFCDPFKRKQQGKHNLDDHRTCPSFSRPDSGRKRVNMFDEGHECTAL